MTPILCAELARDEFGTSGGYKSKSTAALDKEICQSLIGTSFNVCSELWNLIDPVNTINGNPQPKHLFWALLLMNTYCTEPILIRVVGGVDSGTFRKWAWLFIDKIAALKSEVVSRDYFLLRR